MEAKNTYRRKNGFTLIEILISIIILVIALTPMAGVISNSLENNLDIEHKTRTAFLAQMKMEEAKIKTIAHFDHDYSEPVTAFVIPDSAFKYTIAISDVVANEIKLIQVNVWYDSNGIKKQETVLYTKVARRGNP